MRILRALGLLAVYAAVVVWLTWPLAAGATTGIADGVASLDVLYSMWAMAWASVILPTAPAAPADAPIYHPTPLAYFYGPSALGGVPLFAPVYWTTGNPVLATNVAYLGGLALTAWTMHLVVARWTGSWPPAVAAAAVHLGALTPGERVAWRSLESTGRGDVTLLARSGDELVFRVGTSR